MGIFNYFKPANINKGYEEYLSTDRAILLDVRSEEEYNSGHLKGSINLPLTMIDKIYDITDDKTAPLFVYCHSGVRSGQAVNFLKKEGFLSTKNIGGITTYNKPLEK